MCYLSRLFFSAQTLELSLLLPALEEALLSAAVFHQWSVALCCWQKVWVENRSWRSGIGGESSSQVLHQILAPFDVLVYLECCNKIPEWVAYKQFFFFFYSSEGWKPKMRVPYSGSQSSCYVLTEQKELCEVSLYKPALISFISTPLSWLKHFPNTPSPNTISLDIRISTNEFGEGYRCL